MPKIEVIQADITKVEADALVNAANSSLMGGSGVDGAIHRVGGATILEECKLIRARQGGCKTGQAVATTAGNLPAKYVIHTVGPIWQGGESNESKLLTQCYLSSLDVAEKLDCQSIAFPNISTGVYHFPKADAAKIALTTVKKRLGNLQSIERVIFVCYDMENYQLYQNLMAYLSEL